MKFRIGAFYKDKSGAELSGSLDFDSKTKEFSLGADLNFSLEDEIPPIVLQGRTDFETRNQLRKLGNVRIIGTGNNILYRDKKMVLKAKKEVK